MKVLWSDFFDASPVAIADRYDLAVVVRDGVDVTREAVAEWAASRGLVLPARVLRRLVEGVRAADRLPPRKARTAGILIRVSPEELERAHAAARAAGCSVSDLVRRLVCGAPAPRPTGDAPPHPHAGAGYVGEDGAPEVSRG